MPKLRTSLAALHGPEKEKGERQKLKIRKAGPPCLKYPSPVSGTRVEVHHLRKLHKTGCPTRLGVEHLLGLRVSWWNGRLCCGCLECAVQGLGQKRSPSSQSWVPMIRHCSTIRVCLGVELLLRFVDVFGLTLRLMLMTSCRVFSARSGGSGRFHVDSFYFVMVFESL